jgi:hypothetical protein
VQGYLVHIDVTLASILTPNRVVTVYNEC